MPRWHATTEKHERIYAIGDVHGCFRQLEELLDLIAHDNARRSAEATPSIIFLGDFIDRGPDSAKVIDKVMTLSEENSNVFALKGNHEQVFCDIAGGDLMMLDDWLRMGGRATLRSYGIDPDWAKANKRDLPERLNDVVPANHIPWINHLPLTARSNDYFFCHAGVRPGVRLSRQQNEDLLWIRRDFLNDDRPHGAVVVHGHSIEFDVVIRHNRIGVDTGAYKTGRLSAIMLDGDQYDIIKTAG